jgi:hypothetical protein
VKDIPINCVSHQTSNREKDDDTQARCFHGSPREIDSGWQILTGYDRLFADPSTIRFRSKTHIGKICGANIRLSKESSYQGTLNFPTPTVSFVLT